MAGMGPSRGVWRGGGGGSMNQMNLLMDVVVKLKKRWGADWMAGMGPCRGVWRGGGGGSMNQMNLLMDAVVKLENR